jgi:triphosphatase
MSLESELKFRAGAGKLKPLGDTRAAGVRLGECNASNLVSTYFDTPKQKLHRRGFTLRVRQVGNGYLQTVKSSASGNFARGEWETPVDSGAPDFREITRTPLGDIATKKLRRKLEPVFRTSVHRMTRMLHVGSSEVELAIDRGNLVVGSKSEPISEFELELKKGRSEDLFRVAKLFNRRAGAELDLRSKADRGYRLANGDKLVVVHAGVVELTDEMTAGEAFNVIAHSTLHHFSANADLVRKLDGEAIHQMRVGLRRLRAAISLFGDILPGASTAKIKAELKWLTNELAPAREADVFMKERVEPLAHEIEPRRAGRALEQQFSARRRISFQQAREALETSRYRELLIEVIEWLERLRGHARPAAKAPIGKFASEILYRRVRKARKKGRRLDRLSARDRHKLRIQIKKIRYAVDFFRSLYSGKAQDDLQRLSGRLKKIQQALGALNDFVAHQEMATQAALHAPRKNRRAQAFASGMLVGQEREASKTLMKAAFKQIRRLRPLQVEPP